MTRTSSASALMVRSGVTRTTAVASACLLIAQLNYSKCGADHTLKRAPSRQAAELTPAEVNGGCAIAAVWPDLHMIEVRCPERSKVKVQRFCIDGATIGSFRKKDHQLVNCLIEPPRK